MKVKKIFAIILTLLIAWPLMLKVFVFSSWQINQEYIAKTSCVERNNPKSDCAGQCQLAKQLKDTEPTEKPFTPPSGVEKVELSTNAVLPIDSLLVNSEDSSIIYFKQEGIGMPFGAANSLFHPPESLV